MARPLAANRAVVEAYGLDPADFEHILSNFPGFARKRAAFAAYVRERLAEWAKEALAAAPRETRYLPRATRQPANAVAERLENDAPGGEE